MANDKFGKLNWSRYRYSVACPIVRWEKRMFGWHYEGKEKDVIDQGYEGTVNLDTGRVTIEKKWKVIKYACFARPRVFPKNFLFSLTEKLAMFVSFFRRLVFRFLIAAIIVMAVVAGTADSGSSTPTTLGTVFAVLYIGLPLLSIGLGLLGKLWRKVFKLDQTCDQILDENGYVPWSITPNKSHMG